MQVIAVNTKRKDKSVLERETSSFRHSLYMCEEAVAEVNMLPRVTYVCGDIKGKS